MNSIRMHSDGPPWWLTDTFKAPPTRAKAQVSAADRKMPGKPYSHYNHGLAGKGAHTLMCVLLGMLYLCSSGPVYGHPAHSHAGMVMSYSHKAISGAQANVFAWPVDYGISEQFKAYADIGPPRPGGAVRHGPGFCPIWISLTSHNGIVNPLKT
jgi:hypothetical protein